MQRSNGGDNAPPSIEIHRQVSIISIGGRRFVAAVPMPQAGGCAGLGLNTSRSLREDQAGAARDVARTRRRSALGRMPVNRLNTVAKYCEDENPSS